MLEFITKRKEIQKKREALAKRLCETMQANKLYTVTYTNTDGTDLFTRNFTQSQIDNNLHLAEITDSPLLREYSVLKIEEKGRIK